MADSLHSQLRSTLDVVASKVRARPDQAWVVGGLVQNLATFLSFEIRIARICKSNLPTAGGCQSALRPRESAFVKWPHRHLCSRFQCQAPFEFIPQF